MKLGDRKGINCLIKKRIAFQQDVDMLEKWHLGQRLPLMSSNCWLQCDTPTYRCDNEVNEHTAAENEFVTLKKVR